ncbi:MAG: substrate-binding domain-containing protein, partial [Ktedonobacteraceae bacterium]|nr:substrate-binding domain-containing protein [Ktedonobacteraceae bacterium]
MEETAWSTYKLRRRTLLSSAATLASGVVLLSCDDANAPNPSDAVKNNFVLALVKGVQDDAFYTTMQKGAQIKAKELAATLLVDAPARFDAKLQIPIVNAMVARKVDALIIAACDKEAMIGPLQRAHDAGIKIISVDTYIGDGDYTQGPVTFPISYIGSDNVEGGKIAGIALIKALGGKGKIYIQNVSTSISTNAQREQGCRSAIQATNGAV